MKRICALVAALIAAASCFASCGSGDSSSSAAEVVSSSQADSSAAGQTESAADSSSEAPAESSAAESVSESVAESKAESAASDSSSEAAKGDRSGWGPLAKDYTERLEGGVYSVDMTVSSAMTGDISMLLEVNGKNAHMKTNYKVQGTDVEAYIIDGKTYSLLPAMNAYTVSENGSIEDQKINTYALADNAELLETGEEDGLKTETYKIPLGSENAAVEFFNTVKFYFDDNGNAKKIVAEAPVMGSTTVVINSLVFEDVTVELPDLSGMTRLEEGAASEVDPKDALKMTMSMLGITEEMLTKSGYTVDQLAAMDSEEMITLLAKIAQENGIE